jgi:hypothetical protein
MKSWARSMTQQGSVSQTNGATMATTTTTPSSGSTL